MLRYVLLRCALCYVMFILRLVRLGYVMFILRYVTLRYVTLCLRLSLTDCPHNFSISLKYSFPARVLYCMFFLEEHFNFLNFSVFSITYKVCCKEAKLEIK